MAKSPINEGVLCCLWTLAVLFVPLVGFFLAYLRLLWMSWSRSPTIQIVRSSIAKVWIPFDNVGIAGLLSGFVDLQYDKLAGWRSKGIQIVQHFWSESLLVYLDFRSYTCNLTTLEKRSFGFSGLELYFMIGLSQVSISSKLLGTSLPLRSKPIRDCLDMSHSFASSNWTR